MKLTAISFENYKTFKQKESINIKPLTILIGRNNSGKSVIVRLPLLIAHALSDRAVSPLDLEFDGLDFGSSFVDLIHNRILHGAVGIGATFETYDGESSEFYAKVQHFDEYKLQLITHFAMNISQQPVLDLEWTGANPLVDSTYYHDKETSQNFELHFSGLFPTSFINSPLDEITIKTFNLISSYIKEFFYITYFGPFRTEPKRIYRFPGGRVHKIGSSGEKTAELLGDDFLRGRGTLLSTVNRWFSSYLGGWQLDLFEQGEVFSLILRNPKNPSLEVNIADVGTGIAQILPIVVQRHIAGQLPGLEIVEQPELHLHPGVHGDLADLYIGAVRQTKMSFIVETHSENFLLRVRRRIAEGKLDPKKVIIYWINDEFDSTALIQTIKIDERGEVDFWPSEVFSEDFQEVRAIRKAQKDHHK